jgi:negative regulator of sigma-B (phosphoserine phosphatase)
MGTLESESRAPRAADLELAQAGRPLPGEAVSGDAAVALECASGVLLAVCDGLGHGPEAAEASAAALDVLEALPAETPLPVLFDACHEALLRTRGVALTLAFLDAATGTLSWAGIGNVDAVLLRADGSGKALLNRGGVVGYRMPAARVEVLPLQAGDLLVLATDGIASRFPSEIERSASCEEVAQAVLRRCAKDTDDALVLAARWRGV